MLPNPTAHKSCMCIFTSMHSPRSTSVSLLHLHSHWSTPMARPLVIKYNTPNGCATARRERTSLWNISVLTQCMILCAAMYLNWIHFILWLCCLCGAVARLWAWCGMGICLWAILITSRNGKCLMCSGEVIDIDLCCRGLWRGSIIAGSRQSQVCIIRLKLCVSLSVRLCEDTVGFLTVVQHGNVTHN